MSTVRKRKKKLKSCSKLLFVLYRASATNKAFLRQMGITHILNTAEGSRFGQVDTGHAYYRDVPQIRYMGFPLTDHPSTDISRYFYIAAKFIDNAISSGGQFYFLLTHSIIIITLKLFNVTCFCFFFSISGKVLVHCQVDTGINSLSMTYY